MAESKKTAEQAAVPAEKTVKIRIPRTRKDEEDVPVWVNDRSWMIQRGVEVEVPECVAEVLRHKDEMIEQAMLYEESVKK
jgi:hypothetical protein